MSPAIGGVTGYPDPGQSVAMRRRGPPLAEPKPEFPNRIRYWRVRRSLSQGELGERVGLNHRTVGKIERGDQEISLSQLGRFARALDVGIENLAPEGPEISLPIKWTVRSFEAEGGDPELHRPWAFLAAPPRLAQPDECSVAVVDDDSADRLYPRGSLLIVRKLAKPASLRPGQKVIVRRFINARDQETMEILVGILQRGALGDIEVSLRSNDRRLGGAITVRRSGISPGLSDRYASVAAPSAGFIDYSPLMGDDAEIIGIVVMAVTPE